MKKKVLTIILFILIILIICIMISIPLWYRERDSISSDVISYGKELTLYDILGKNLNINKYGKLNDYTYKKAKVDTIGSTAQIHETIDNNEIVYIGNRNLIEINHELYVYDEGILVAEYDKASTFYKLIIYKNGDVIKKDSINSEDVKICSLTEKQLKKIHEIINELLNNRSYNGTSYSNYVVNIGDYEGMTWAMCYKAEYVNKLDNFINEIILNNK